MRRLFHAAAIFGGPLSLVSLATVLAACGSSGGGSTVQSRSNAYSAFCADVVMCVEGRHWDEHACQCVLNEDDAGPAADAAADGSPSTSSGVCPDNVLCIRGDHWDPTQCRCVPDDDAGTDDAGAADDAAAADDAGDDATPPCDGH